MASLEERIQTLLLPKDPNEGRNVIMEIRGAVGGDEANLFARVLYDMYLRYAAMKKWKVEVLSEDASEKDGINEAVFLVKGPDAYIRLEHEAGHAPRAAGPGDRGEGRIHTSTATVTVLPEADRGRDRHRPERPQDRRLPLHRARAGSRSTRPTPPCASRTSRPGPSWPCRTRRARFRTGPRPWWCCGPGC